MKKPEFVNLYYLYNWESDEVFYVGATAKPDIEKALSQHFTLCQKKWGKPESWLTKRSDYIRKYKRHITIHLLERVPFDDVNVREAHHYHYFINQGFTLIQSDDSFHYNKPFAITTDHRLDYETLPKNVWRADDNAVKQVA